MFLCAKSASAATAALGFAGYVLAAIGASTPTYRVVLALVAVAALTAVVAGGMHRSRRANTIIVTMTIAALVGFVVVGFPSAVTGTRANLSSLLNANVDEVAPFLHATALMFVAYTGYGRIATLGEEVRDPQRSIPRAIVWTLLATAALYGAVTYVAVASAGTSGLMAATRHDAAPLEVLARSFDVPEIAWLVAAGAITAMLGVLLNLVLGLSRVVLAMARRRDMPTLFARIDPRHSSPRAAVLLVGGLIAGLTAIGNVKTTWSFSAFTVLVYYALTNLAALRLPRDARLYPRWTSAAGLLSCLGLVFWVEPHIWVSGLALIALGLVWRWLSQRRAADS